LCSLPDTLSFPALVNVGSSLPVPLQSDFKVTDSINLRLDGFSMEKYELFFFLSSFTLGDSNSRKNVFQITWYSYQILFCMFLLDEIKKEYNVSTAHLLK